MRPGPGPDETLKEGTMSKQVHLCGAGSPAMSRRSRRRRIGGVVAGALVAAAVVAGAPSSATAALPIDSLTATVSDTAAGAHADVSIDLAITPTGVDPAEHLRNLEIQLPAGMMGDPQAIPTCSSAQLASFQCPPASQVGSGQIGDTSGAGGLVLYNLDAEPGEPARIGIAITGVASVPLPTPPARITVRSGGDYGLTTTVRDIPALTLWRQVSLELWGVPEDHLNLGGPRAPFMANPTDCSAVAQLATRVNSWEDGSYTRASADLPQMAGCDAVPFDAQIQTSIGSRAADSAGSFTVEVINPQNRDPDGLAAGHLKTAVVELPEGLSINPATAHDTTACSDGAFARRSDEASHCPASSKVGTVGITTPLLANPIPGDIYLGEPQSGNPFRVFVYAEGSGVRIKLEGSIQADPRTGKLTATFNDNPPLPFNVFRLNFRGGARSVLAMPPTCGLKTATAAFTSYTGTSVGAGSGFNIFGNQDGAACSDPMPFSPGFSAGSTNGNGGQDTGFTLTFGRNDGEQTLKSLKASLPPGLLGRLPALPMCPVAAAAAVECGDESLVGGVVVSSGAGSSPLNLAGKVWLAEPRNPDEIASLAIFVPAAAGPYHLGNVVVFTGLKVRPDAGLDIASDPLPTILHGVPLRIRQVIVEITRDGFMFNPTNCAPGDITGAVTSNGGAEVGVSSPFGLSNCGALAFAPKMTLGSASPAKSGGTVPLNVRIEPTAGEANMRIVQLTLPAGVSARLDGPVQSPCTEEQFAKNECPEASRVGKASASTPAIAFPVTSNVWLVENKGGALPKLAMRLRGGPVDIPLVGDIELDRSARVKTTFSTIPDVPLTAFELSLDGDSHSPLQAKSLCGKSLKADLLMTGQNGRQTHQSPKLAVAGCKASAASKAKAKKQSTKNRKRARTARRHA
jgi:hypothetical protein